MDVKLTFYTEEVFGLTKDERTWNPVRKESVGEPSIGTGVT